MRSYDPYDQYIRAQEIKEARWEASRPTCEACGDRILTEERYDIGGRYFCEDCINDAWKDIQKSAHSIFFNAFGDRERHYFIMEAIVERMLETFEFGDFKQEIQEENE